MRIVYVEDNIANVHLVKRVARMGKHEVINYIDGMDAFNNFEMDDPDLVLMDIQLAGELTGIEVVKKLREKGFRTPIFAVTAYAMVGDKERCIEAGCTGYMSKPIPVPELVKLFNEYNRPRPSTLTESHVPPAKADSPPTIETALPDTPTLKQKPDNFEEILAKKLDTASDVKEQTVSQRSAKPDEVVTDSTKPPPTKPTRPLGGIKVSQSPTETDDTSKPEEAKPDEADVLSLQPDGDNQIEMK